jgi:hypothetical protein
MNPRCRDLGCPSPERRSTAARPIVMLLACRIKGSGGVSRSFLVRSRVLPCARRASSMFLPARKLRELSPADIELIREAAGALARYGERLEKALRQLRSAEDLLESCERRGSLSSRQAAVEQYKTARSQAETARHLYIVQREAVGFRNHKFADCIYPLPPPRSLPRCNGEKPGCNHSAWPQTRRSGSGHPGPDP